MTDTPSAVGPDDVSTAIITPLILDFLEWLDPEPRPYAEVMETWRTSCPRLTVWEDAIDGGFVARKPLAGRPAAIEVTASGRRLLAEAGRPRRDPSGGENDRAALPC